MIGNYILDDDGQPRRIDDALEWARKFDDEMKIIKHDHVGEILVSTVFLGLDHNFGGKGPPVLFETMVFGGPLDEEQERYCTREEALAGHAAMVERVKAAPPQPTEDE